MSRHRFFLDAVLGGPDDPLPLGDAEIKHAASSLRIREGEEIHVVDPTGVAHRVRVRSITTRAIFVDPLEKLPTARMPRISLVCGLAKNEAMDDVIRHATEIGVRDMRPMVSSRSVVKLDPGKAAAKLERWRRIALSAAKQSRRSDVPAVLEPLTVREVARQIASYDVALVLWEGASGPAIRDVVPLGDLKANVALIVGPEGGLSAEEVDTLVDSGAVAVTLGPTIMRTETAVLVALALTAEALGGLGHARD